MHSQGAFPIRTLEDPPGPPSAGSMGLVVVSVHVWYIPSMQHDLQTRLHGKLSGKGLGWQGSNRETPPKF